MAELETAAWLTCRRFRVLCLDRTSLSFSDLYLHSADSPPSNVAPEGLREQSVEGSTSMEGATFGIAAEEATQQAHSSPIHCLTQRGSLGGGGVGGVDTQLRHDSYFKKTGTLVTFLCLTDLTSGSSAP